MDEVFRCNNKDVRPNVRSRTPFLASNMHGDYITSYSETGTPITLGYAVFSYGAHFPMYVYDYEHHVWVGNSDKYSVTTSKHQSLANPGNVSNWVDTETMVTISKYGLNKALVDKLTNNGRQTGD